MNIKHIILTLAAAAMTLSLTGCQNSFDDPGLQIPEASIKANTTIAEFKKAFGDKYAVQIGKKESGEDYILHGRVCSSDASGNIYQNMEFQDETGAIVISVRRPSLYEVYHLGQEIVLNATGLWFGQYNSLRQFGWLGEQYGGNDQMTFMSYPALATHVELNGLPAPETQWITVDDFKAGNFTTESLYGIIEDIDKLPTSGDEMLNLQGQLVQFNNVTFVDDQKQPTGGIETYAPYQETVNRYIQQEGSSLLLTVRNSGYATFYNDLLPEGTGTLRGILSWYGNGTSSNGAIGGWQLYIRSLDDVIFNSEGSKADPYSIAQVIEMQGEGNGVWSKGYIVGSVMGGVNAVTAPEDIIFGPAAEMTNNIVVAADPDETDWTKCVAVELPQNTDLRTYANLVDNPGNYKKEIILKGNFESFLGMPGITDNDGSKASFSIEGLDLGGSGEQAVVYSGLSDSCDFTFDNVKLPSQLSYVWNWDSSYHYLKASAYSGQSYASESWAISPEIDLTGCTNAQLAFQHVVNKFPDLDFAKQSTGLYVRENGGQWQEIAIPTYGTNDNWTFVAASVDIPASFNGKKIQLGFKYTSEDGKSGTWEVKEVTVKADK